MYSGTGRSSVEALVGKFTLYSNYLVQPVFFWCGNSVPTPLFLALHPYTWPLQPIVFKWRQNSPSTGFDSWSRTDTTWMRCATLDLVMLRNRKFDIPCKLDISRNLSTFLSQLHWQASWSFATQFHGHEGGFGGLSPSETKLQALQIQIWRTIKQ